MRRAVTLAVGLIAAGALVWWAASSGSGEAPSPSPSPTARASAEPTRPAARTATAIAERTPLPVASTPPPPSPPPPPPPPPPVGKDSALSGLLTRELTAQDRQELKLPEKLWGGVVVRDVDPTSPAAEARLAPNDVIYRAGGAKITSWDDLARAIGDREQTRIQAYRGGQAFEVVLQRPWKPAP